MTEATTGVLAMVGACVVWGFSALYYELLAAIPRWRYWRIARCGRSLSLLARLRCNRD